MARPSTSLEAVKWAWGRSEVKAWCLDLSSHPEKGPLLFVNPLQTDAFAKYGKKECLEI